MKRNDGFEYEPFEYDDFYQKPIVPRKKIKKNNPSFVVDEKKILNSGNYTRRTQKRRPKQATSSYSEGKRKKRGPVNGQVRVTKRPTSRSAQKSSRYILSIFCVIIILFVFGSSILGEIYTSENIFADKTNGDINKNAIEERLITSMENKDKVTYFLIVGVDKSSMLTDCIWIMCFDNQAHKMNVLQVPRDTYVGYDALSPYKINGVYANPKTVKWCESCGRAVDASEIKNSRHTECNTKVTKKQESNINALIRCLNNRLKLPIDHYVLFDFEGFKSVVDAMGGVDIYLENDLKVYPNKKDYVQLYAGENHLDGDLALKFMRNRKAYIEGDLGRVRAQRQIIHAMLEKVDKMSTLETLSVLKSAYGKFSTDMSISDIRSFISPVKKCGTDGLNMFELPGESYWVKPNPSYYLCNIKQTVDVINENMLPYSEKITAEDINFPIP